MNPNYLPEQAGDYYEQSSSFPILEYLQLLWFRKRLIAAVTIFITIAGFIHVNQLSPVYTASSTLMIGAPQTRVLDIEQVLTRDYYGDAALVEIEVLRSRNLADKVIDKLGLLHQAEFNPALREPDTGLSASLKYLNPKNWIPKSWEKSVREAISGEIETPPVSEEDRERRTRVRATDILLNKLSASRIEFTNAIAIGFSSGSAEMAAKIANAVPQTYIADQLQAKFDATRNATDWLTEQLADLESKVAESERAVETYREEHGLTKVENSSILTAQLTSINSELISARAQRADVETRLSELSRLLKEADSDLYSAVEFMSSPLIQQLRIQEAQAMGRISELSVELGPKHPRMLQANAEIDEIRRQIDEEITKLQSALENELEMARTREKSLESRLSEAEQKSGIQNREAVDLRALEREAAANQLLFETFLNRFKETSSTEGLATSDARIISSAEVPLNPSYPNKKRLLTTISMMGFLLACGVVFGLQYLSPGLFSPEQVERELGVHVLGVIPKLPADTDPLQFLQEKPGSSFSESINSLRVSLRLSDPDNKTRVFQVTSSVPEEGKSSLAITLAAAIARSGQSVALIDADLRRSSIEEKLGLNSEGPGLSDLLVSNSDQIGDYLVRHEPSEIHFMRTGDAKYASATDIFSSRRMEAIIARLNEKFDYVFIDTPPVMAVADARIIGRLADRTIFVLRWDKTPRKVARTALKLLHEGGSEIAGIVLQQVDLQRYGKLGYGDSAYYYHHGRYGQYYKG
jgi:capsular exopolysaccharide synthesis family protein